MEDKQNADAPAEQEAPDLMTEAKTPEAGDPNEAAGVAPAQSEESEACEKCDEDEKTKVTEEDVLSAIVSTETKTVELAGKPHTVTAVRLANGFTVVETSTAVDIANYDPKIGEQVNLDRIKRKVWLLLGYALQSKLSEDRDVCKADALRATRELLEAAQGQDSLTNEEIENGIALIDSVLAPSSCYKDRARTELKELNARIEKLSVFMRSGDYADVPPVEKQRMEKQLAAMRSYSTVLNQRVANFTAG